MKILMPKPLVYITDKSVESIKTGGNKRGNVPVHTSKRRASSMPLYTLEQMEEAYKKGFIDSAMQNNSEIVSEIKSKLITELNKVIL